jgi:hypothetical protein
MQKVILETLLEGTYYTSNEPSDIYRLISIGSDTCKVFCYAENTEYEMPSDVYVTPYDQTKPILQNLRFFLESMANQIENNNEFSTVNRFQFSINTLVEVLGIIIIDPTQPETRTRLKRDGTPVILKKELFRNVEYGLIGEEIKKLQDLFSFIDTYEHSNNTQIQEVIAYAFVEKMAHNFFDLTNVDTSWRTEHVNYVIDLLNKHPEFDNDKFETACKGLVPNHGPADTIGGELGRGIMKVLYRMWNDGDDPTAYVSASFWALINCWQIALENYSIYMASLPAERKQQDENRRKGQWKPDKLCICGELDPWMLVDLIHFFHHFITTEEGKQSNIKDGKPIWDIIEPHYESVEWYDKSVPYNYYETEY